MFDRIDIRQGPSYPQQVNISQPTTSDQLRNLRETEEKIRKQIVSTHNFNNEFTGRVSTFYDPEMDQHKIEISFRLNGHSYDITKTISRRDFVMDRKEAVGMLIESIAVEIAKSFSVAASEIGNG